MFTGHADDIDGLIPDTADDLQVPEPERRFCLYFLRGQQQSGLTNWLTGHHRALGVERSIMP